MRRGHCRSSEWGGADSHLAGATEQEMLLTT